MSAAILRADGAWGRSSVGIGRRARSALAISAGLFSLAFAVRLLVVGLISFPMTEGSAYYVAVARNLIEGRGLVIDALWSYSTPPLVLPRPAFELWQPMATFLAAIPMAVNAPDFRAAQLGYAVIGALLVPLVWLVARDTTRRLRLPDRRASFVSIGAGVLAALFGPFLFSTAVPDSSLPFTFLAVAAALVVPVALTGNRAALVALGVLLGLSYLTRMEAVWLGLAFVLLLVANGSGAALTIRRAGVVAAVAAIVASPWLLRNVVVFGKPLPGQIADNVFLTHNEQVYAYLDQPTLSGFLDQGLVRMATNIGQAFLHQAIDVLLVPAAPVVIVGVTAIGFALFRRRVNAAGQRSAVSRGDESMTRGALAALLVYGAITFCVTAFFFPVATLWGTFEHASGPILVGMIVAALIGGDAFVAWLVARREWVRENGWLAPAALIALTVPLAFVQMRGAERQAALDQATIATIASELPNALAGVAADRPLITDRPIWLSDALGRPTLALPDEPPNAVATLALRFGAQAVVVVEGRGRYPAEFQSGQPSCFTPLPATNLGGARVFLIEPECTP